MVDKELKKGLQELRRQRDECYQRQLEDGERSEELSRAYYPFPPETGHNRHRSAMNGRRTLSIYVVSRAEPQLARARPAKSPPYSAMVAASCTAGKVPGQRPERVVNVSAMVIGHGWRNSKPAKRAGSERANMPAM